jgi:DNA-binding transcriptional MerR regulator
MKPYYTPNEAAVLTGASKPALRTYTTRYVRYLSTEATPDKGNSRRFTAADLKVIAFIREKTTIENQSHEETMAALARGALEEFAWQLPEEENGQPGYSETNTALVPIERLQTLQAILVDTQRREQIAQERLEQREKELQERIYILERELGKAEGALSTFQSMTRKPASWWTRLFGGREDT